MNTPRRILLAALLLATAAHGATFTVNTTVDQFHTPSGANVSLREALRDAAAFAGADTIDFAPALGGQTITLGSELVVANTAGVTVDASALAGGITLSGGGTNRIFSISATGNVTLRGLTLTGGNGTGATASGSGGAVINTGTLTATRCTFSGNSAVINGGAVSNGASATAAFTQCTFTGNAMTGSTQGGGAINHAFAAAGMTLIHCTIAGNSSAGSEGGGGIRVKGPGFSMQNCIVAGNSITAGAGADVLNDNTLTATGANIVQSYSGTVSGTLTNADPRLAPLADNGGPTQTMALLPGSPALDAATVISGLDTDQRGFSRNRDGNAVAGALPDIGSYEAQAAPFSIGFNFTGGGGPGGTLAAADIAGVPAFAQANWNNLLTDNDGSSTGNAPNAASRNDSTGATIAGLKLWWDAPNVWSVSGTAPTTANEKLMNVYLDSNGVDNSGTDLYAAQNQPFLSVAGLPAALTLGGYKVIAYADGGATDGRIGEYWLATNRGQNPSNITGETDLTPHFFARDTADFSGAFTRATSTNFGIPTDGNYVQFEALTEPAFTVRTSETNFRAPINAVQIIRNEILVVTTAADENDPVGTVGTGLSLREAVALAPDGAGIVFDPTLNGATVTLSATLMDITLNKSVTIDASSLPAGFTISGGGATRIFYIPENSSPRVALRGLTLSGGNGTGNFLFRNGNGGAIGALWDSSGTLTLTQCTLSGNSASSGGAIYNNTGGTLTLTQCTLSGNSASSAGGAIYAHMSPLTLTQCTLSGNSASNQGGAINNTDSTLTLQNSIVAGNTAPNGADIFHKEQFSRPTYNRIGANIVQSVANDHWLYDPPLESGPAAIAQSPLLAPLADNGGPTRTMLPLPGSPAIDAATASTATTDQRGATLPASGRDIGAVETFTLTGFVDGDSDGMDDRLEPLYGFIVGVQDGSLDADGDGSSNAAELGNKTGPRDSTSLLRIVAFTPAGFAPLNNNPLFDVTWTSFPGLYYTIQAKSDLNFGVTPRQAGPFSATDFTHTERIELDKTNPKDFIRVRRN